MMTLSTFALAVFTTVRVYVRTAPDSTGSALSVFVIEKGLEGSADTSLMATPPNATSAAITVSVAATREIRRIAPRLLIVVSGPARSSLLIGIPTLLRNYGLIARALHASLRTWRSCFCPCSLSRDLGQTAHHEFHRGRFALPSSIPFFLGSLSPTNQHAGPAGEFAHSEWSRQIEVSSAL